jgi:hypothetical protein
VRESNFPAMHSSDYREKFRNFSLPEPELFGISWPRHQNLLCFATSRLPLYYLITARPLAVRTARKVVVRPRARDPVYNSFALHGYVSAPRPEGTFGFGSAMIEGKLSKPPAPERTDAMEGQA